MASWAWVPVLDSLRHVPNGIFRAHREDASKRRLDAELPVVESRGDFIFGLLPLVVRVALVVVMCSLL